MSDNEKLNGLTQAFQDMLAKIRFLVSNKLDKSANAVSASRLQTPRTISVTGDGNGSVSFDGSSNVSMAVTLANTGVGPGAYGNATYSLRLTVDSKGRVVACEAVGIQLGSVSAAGLVRLSTAVDSSATDVAATASAVKQAFDLASAAIPMSQKGVANGLATLDSNGQVPAHQLPSFVDDVLEFNNLQQFPGEGERGKLYVALDSNYVYRWSGTTYIWVNASVGASDTAVRLATPRNINGVPFDGTANINLPTVNTNGNQTISGTKTFTDPVAADITGKAAVADKLAVPRTFSLAGDINGTATFDGTGNVDLAVTLIGSGVAAGQYGSETDIPVMSVDTKGRVIQASTIPLPIGSTSKVGIVRLSAAINSTSTAIAATSSAVKQAYDLANSKASLALVGAPNGIASLDANGLVPASQLPSYVDDVIEVADVASLPAEGETGKIYVALDTGNIHRWSGSIYIRIGADAATADQALRLSTARTLSITGDASWSVSFDGTANRSGVLTLAASGVTAGTYGDANTMVRLTVDSKGRVTSVNTIARPTGAANADKLTTARPISISGDGSGTVNFDGTAGVSIPLTLANTGVSAGTYTKVTVTAKGLVVDAGLLAPADIPELAISKTTGLQAALDAKFNISQLSTSVSSTSTTTAATSSAVKQAFDVASAAIPKTWMGVPTGVATLDENGKVPASQLPSYVDDVLEFNTLSAFPTTGETGKIYTDLSSNNIYRWSGSTYIQIGGNSGAADQALKLTTARNIALTGDGSWSVNFDGSQNVSAAFTLAATGVSPGVYSKMTVDAKGRITGGAALLATDIPQLNQSTTGNAGSATKLATARSFTIGSTAKGFDGTANVSWTLAEIGAAPAAHSHDYLPLTGGTVSGVTVISNTTAATSATTGALRVAGGIGCGGDIYASGDVAGFSDARIKTDIEVIEDALERIMSLRGVTYTRTDGEMAGRRQTGLIAQELEEVLPEAVGGTEELKSVAYGNLAGLFVQGIKELVGVVDKQNERLDLLAKQVEEMTKH